MTRFFSPVFDGFKYAILTSLWIFASELLYWKFLLSYPPPSNLSLILYYLILFLIIGLLAGLAATMIRKGGGITAALIGATFAFLALTLRYHDVHEAPFGNPVDAIFLLFIGGITGVASWLISSLPDTPARRAAPSVLLGASVPIVVLAQKSFVNYAILPVDRPLPVIAVLFLIPLLYAWTYRYIVKDSKRAKWALVTIWILPLCVISLWAFDSMAGSDLSGKSSSESRTSSSQTSIIWITVDTMRADHMSLYGYDVPTTPHLEELAQEATVYSRCLAQAPGTSESVPSLLSGVSPYKHGGISLIRSVPEEILLLPETLQEHGYETIALSANPWVSGYHGLDQGFEVFRSYNTDNELFIYDIVKLLRRIAPWKVFHYRNCLPVVSYVPISRLIEDAVDILQTRDWSRPLFLYIHPLDPHGPYQPPSRYLHVNEEEFTPEDYIYFKDLNPGVKVNQRQYRMITALYDGEITYVDAELDRLLDVLKREGLYESSLIIITSDHGEQFQEHDLWQHSNSLYQQLLHVPLIIKFPYQEEGEVVDEWVATIDIVPTVLDRLGIHSDGVEGMPLNRPYIAGPRPFFSYKMDGELNSQPTMRGVMLDGWKLIMIPEGNGMKEELYRVNIDPSDSNDLRQAYPEIAVRLDGILEEYERRTVQADILKTKTIDSREEERLRSLGYIE